jgi:hypothetical protein
MAITADDAPIDCVRRRIGELFRQLGAADGCFSETILIRDGYYCGRKFSCDVAQAIWFMEENQIKVYNRGGNLWAVHEALALQDGQDLADENSRRAA